MTEQDQYLQAMGIQRWVLRQTDAAVEDDQVVSDNVVATADTNSQVTQAVAQSTPIAMADALSNDVEKTNADVGISASPQDWARLQQQVRECTACTLHSGRKQTVFGVGDQRANWMIIGEAPGADEDAQGEPFVGRAGKLLNAMLLGIGLQREQVFIANILKCRPPNNRDPRPEEAQACWSFLRKQIAYISPKIILAVGRISAQNLLQTEEAIGRLRGRVHRLSDPNIPVVVTYHPAYLLRKPSEKRKSWEDLKLAYRAAHG